MWSTLIKAPWGYITPAPFIVLEAHRLDDAPFFQIRHPALDLAQPEPCVARDAEDARCLIERNNL
jgi:hypothetical protein